MTVVRVVRPSTAGGVRWSVGGGHRRYVRPGRSSALPPCDDRIGSGAPEPYPGEVVAFRPPLRGSDHRPHVVLDEGSEDHRGSTGTPVRASEVGLIPQPGLVGAGGEKIDTAVVVQTQIGQVQLHEQVVPRVHRSEGGVTLRDP